MDDLPEELIRLLLLQMSPEDILSFCSLNFGISQICNNDEFWHQVTNINWPEQNHKPHEIDWKQFTLLLLKTTKLIPIYLRIDVNNYKLIAKLRLYKNTSIDYFSHDLGKTIQALDRLNLPIDKDGYKIITNIRECSDHPIFSNHRPSVSLLISGNKFQATINIMITYGFFRLLTQLYSLASEFPPFFRDPQKLVFDTHWYKRGRWNFTVSNIPLREIYPDCSECANLSLYQALSAIIIDEPHSRADWI